MITISPLGLPGWNVQMALYLSSKSKAFLALKFMETFTLPSGSNFWNPKSQLFTPRVLGKLTDLVISSSQSFPACVGRIWQKLLDNQTVCMALKHMT